VFLTTFTYCSSGVLQVHIQYIPGSSWVAHHPLPAATPEYSKFILSTSQDHLGMLTTLYLLPLLTTPSSYSVHPRSSWDGHHPLPTATLEFILGTSQIILGYSPPSTCCYSEYSKFILSTSQDHLGVLTHPVPTATPEYSKFILSTSQDHLGMLTTLYLLLLQVHTPYIPGSSWDAHHPLPAATPEYSKFILSTSQDHLGMLTTLYLLLLRSTPSSYSVHPKIILVCSPTFYLLPLLTTPSSYSVHPRSSWDGHHPLPTATPEFILGTSQIILGWSPPSTYCHSWLLQVHTSTSQDRLGILTTLYLLLLWSTPSSYSVHPGIILGCSPPCTYCYSGVFQVHTQYIPGSSWDAHLPVPTATPSSYSVHPRIILGCSPPSTYCYSGVFQVHTQYIPGSSWDAHHPLPAATPEYSKFILSTSQDHLGMLTTLYLLLLRSTPSSYSVHPRITLGCSPPCTCCYSRVFQVHIQYIPRSSWDAHHPLPTATPEYSKFILSISQDHLGILTTLYLLLLLSTPSSYSVHPKIILGCSPPSTYCYSGVFQVHTQYIPGSSWDAHHPLPTATPEYSKFILSTSQDHLGMLTTLYLLPLRSSYSVHPRSSWDAHHPLPTATPEYSKFILSTSQIILGCSPPSTYCYSRVHT